MLRGSRSGTIPQICPPAHAVAKAELWERWRRGESLKAIGRAFGNPPVNAGSIWHATISQKCHAAHKICEGNGLLPICSQFGIRNQRESKYLRAGRPLQALCTNSHN